MDASSFPHIVESIIDHICNVDHRAAIPILGVSRQWQTRIQANIFRHLFFHPSLTAKNHYSLKTCQDVLVGTGKLFPAKQWRWRFPGFRNYIRVLDVRDPEYAMGHLLQTASKLDIIRIRSDLDFTWSHWIKVIDNQVNTCLVVFWPLLLWSPFADEDFRPRLLVLHVRSLRDIQLMQEELNHEWFTPQRVVFVLGGKQESENVQEQDSANVQVVASTLRRLTTCAQITIVFRTAPPAAEADIEFITLEEYRERVGEETYRLYMDPPQ